MSKLEPSYKSGYSHIDCLVSQQDNHKIYCNNIGIGPIGYVLGDIEGVVCGTICIASGLVVLPISSCLEYKSAYYGIEYTITSTCRLIDDILLQAPSHLANIRRNDVIKVNLSLNKRNIFNLNVF